MSSAPLFALPRLFAACAVLAVSWTHLRAAEPVEIKEGDRVLLLGDVLLERENTYGYLETRMHEQFPAQKFSVRNLSWAGDTPLGWSRASFDPPAKGFDRLKEQIALVKPTVVFLGYGMAASLQEITDRSGDWTLNPDPTRYGAEPMTAARFKGELARLMDAIKEGAAGAPVRFVLLSPIRHEDLRAKRPNLPDPAPHNALLAEYTKAISELATERNVAFVDLFTSEPPFPATDNGIHLSWNGEYFHSFTIGKALGWNAPQIVPPEKREPIRTAILRKNALWFHRTRPANETYLTGFRKHEQGQNAKEIPEFDPLVEAADAEIDRVKRPGATAASPPAKAPETAAAPAKPTATPLPSFDLADGLEISLWAENPLLVKPTQMNWDALGRLWVCGTALYPQIAPGGVETDQIFILEDTDHDGKADKSTPFAGGLLLPTGVEPDLVPTKDKGKFQDACYVGASTELLRFGDENGDGRAEERRIVLSGFGTEDTHHTVHTLHWAPDGRLYFDQSVYIHTHLETPWGMVRLNAGGVFAYDPKTERVEVFSKGLWNPWGHQIDAKGQHYLTDGAGRDGIAWAFPGSVFAPSEGARSTAPTISPGTYPKFAGLEIIRTPLFPDDWQGDAITCDFRAHRIVRFKIKDLAQAEAGKERSGFVTQEMPDVARTADVTFRPIDAKLGPDGALYIADWSNPVINHGEVDFRDPRRDKVHGRIWRIAYKGREAAKWSPVPTGASENHWADEQAQRTQFARGEATPKRDLDNWAAKINDPSPRARLMAMRALALKPTLEGANQILTAAVNTPAEDPYYTFAAWRSVNDVAAVWVDAVLKGDWKLDAGGPAAERAAREKQLEFALGAIEPGLAGKALGKLLAEQTVPADGSGPWIELIGRSGSAEHLTQLFNRLVSGEIKGPVATRVLRALAEAARSRSLRPTSDLKAIGAFLQSPDADFVTETLRVSGPWQIRPFVPLYAQQARSETPGLRAAALDALRDTGGPEAVAALHDLCGDTQPAPLRRRAVAALAAVDLKGSLAQIADVITDQTSEGDAIEAWRSALSAKGAPDTLAQGMPRTLTKPVAAAGLKAARELGKKGEKLAAVLAPLAGEAVPTTTENFADLASQTVSSGDPAAGEEIYRRATSTCAVCHAIGGAGGKVGPELGTIGASAPLDYIIESLLVPNAKVKEGYNAVTLTLKDGTVAMGVPVRESGNDLVLRNAAGQEQTLVKANITGRENLGSIMPPGLLEPLKPRERLNLYAFLSQLGKAGIYDASKGHIARTWWLYGEKEAAAGIASLKGGEAAPFILSNVDGRVPRERLTEQVAIIPPGGAVYAVAKLTVATAAKTQLQLAGVREAWLDGQPLAVASEPSLPVDLSVGNHVLAVKLDREHLPEVLRAEAAGVRFLTE